MAEVDTNAVLEENAHLRRQLQAAMNTIEALKQRVVDLNFQIVDGIAASISHQQEAEMHGLHPVPDEVPSEGEAEAAT